MKYPQEMEMWSVEGLFNLVGKGIAWTNSWKLEPDKFTVKESTHLWDTAQGTG